MTQKKHYRTREYQQAEAFTYHDDSCYLEQTLNQVKVNPAFLFYVDNDLLRRHVEEDEVLSYVQELHLAAYESFSANYGAELNERFQNAMLASSVAELRRVRIEPFLKIAWVFTPEACSEDVFKTIQENIPKC